MLNMIRDRLALSESGAKDFLKGIFWTTLLNFALMLPAIYSFIFIDDIINYQTLSDHSKLGN